jgi:hypothetical protein
VEEYDVKNDANGPAVVLVWHRLHVTSMVLLTTDANIFSAIGTHSMLSPYHLVLELLADE